jgi:hypothetical protein
MLPRPRLFDLIINEPRQLGSDRPLLARRPQSKIDVIQRAFRRGGGERCDKPLCEARIVLSGRKRPLAV